MRILRTMNARACERERESDRRGQSRERDDDARTKDKAIGGGDSAREIDNDRERKTENGRASVSGRCHV